MNNIIAFGDSILKGISLIDGSYKVNPLRFTDVIGEKLRLKIDNRARMGSTIADLGKMLFRSRQVVESPEYGTVLLEYGGNDCDFDWQAVSDNPELPHSPKTEIGAFVREYTEKVRALQAMGKQVLMLSLPPIDAQKYFGWITKGRNAEAIFNWLEKDVSHLTHWHEMFNLKVFEIGASVGAKVLDISSCLLAKPNYTRFLCADGIHLNAEGQRIIAEVLTTQLGELFGRETAPVGTV